LDEHSAVQELPLKSKILVTGATGFIGSYIIRYLLKQGYEHIIAIHRSSSRFELLADSKDQVQWVEADLGDVDRLNEIIAEVDYIIHAAAIVSFHRKDRQKMYQCNVDYTRDLINIALRHQVKKFIHISSIAALGRSHSTALINEKTSWAEHPLNSYYGKTKYLGELEVWRAAAEGMNILIFNPSLVLGAGFWKLGTAAMFNILTKNIPFYPLGGNGFVDVRDVAKYCVAGLASSIKNQRFILNAENLSYRDLFTPMAQKIEAKVPRKPFSNVLLNVSGFFIGILERLGIPVPINKHQMSIMNSSSQYDGSLAVENFQIPYTPLQSTIEEAGTLFNRARKEGKDFSVLPVN